MASNGNATSLNDQKESMKNEENRLAEEARKGGADVLQFDPDASPEEKAAQAKKAIPPALKITKPNVGF